MKNDSSTTERARIAFQRFLDEARDPAPDFARLLSEADPALRGELEHIVADYEALRALMSDAPAPLDGERIGDFRLLNEIGRGGMGIIWEAEQVSLHRRVALKLLHPHFSLSAGVIGRFRLEAEAGARVRHPGIVAVIAVGEHEGRWFLAQELVEGGMTLADRIAGAREELDAGDDYYRENAALFVAIADALQAAHEAGVVHRDVKPSNILITEEGLPKVADFGLAKVTDELGFSRTGQLLGTPFYMSPEQAAGGGAPIDHRTDVFSLGATLYETLTLRRPFEGDTSQQVLGQILLEDPPDPHRLRSRCPRELATICLKALEKEPQHRYQSAAELRDDLQRFLDHRTILARPPGAVRRAQKWVQRNPALAAGLAGTALALAVISGLLVSTSAAHREAQEQALVAEQRADQAQASASMLESTARFVTDVFRGQLVTKNTDQFPVNKRLLDDLAQDVRRSERLGGEERSQRLEIVGRLQTGIGRYEQAEALLRESLAWRLEAFGPQDARTLRSMVLLAETLAGRERWGREGAPHDPERWREAETLARRAEQGFAGEPRRAEDAWSARAVLADVLSGTGRLEQAAALQRAVLAARRDLLGPTRSETLATTVALADVEFRRGDDAEGRRLLLDAAAECAAEPERPEHCHLILRTLGRQLEIQTATPRPKPPSAALAEARLPALSEPLPFAMLATYTEDEPTALFSLLPEIAPLLSDRPNALRDLASLGNHTQAEGRVLRAANVFSLVAHAAQRLQGTGQFDTIASFLNLANALRLLGRHEQAAPLYRRSAELFRVNMGPDHGFTLNAETEWAVNELERGDPSRAEELLADAVERAREHQGLASPVTVNALRQLALVYARTERYAQAQGLLDEVDTVCVALGEDHRSTLDLRVQQGELLLGMGEAETACLLLEQTLARCRAVLGPSHGLTCACSWKLARALDARGEPEAALALLNDAVRCLAQNLGPDGGDTRRCAQELEQLLSELGRTPDPDLAELLASLERR